MKKKLLKKNSQNLTFLKVHRVRNIDMNFLDVPVSREADVDTGPGGAWVTVTGYIYISVRVDNDILSADRIRVECA